LPNHFLTSDYLGILAAFLLFPLIVLLPGYAIGWLTNVLRFRSRTFAFRLTASVPLAITVGPTVSFAVGRLLNLDAVLWIYGVLSVVALGLFGIAVRKGEFHLPWRKMAPFAGFVALWLVIALAMLTDIQIGRKLYFSIIAFDYAVRTEFTQAISTFGVPAQNPFFYPGHATVLRYHYFWMIPCALVQRLSGGLADARQAFVAGSMWCGIGLLSLVLLYLRAFSPQGAANLYRRGIIGIALMGVTGLDILGALFLVFLNRQGLIPYIPPSVEWWNNQVDGWLYTMLWEPHYLCALMACLTGFLVLWDVPEETGLAPRIIPAVVAGLGFSTAAGAGIYIDMIFAAFMAVWTLITILKRWFRETAMLCTSGVVALEFTKPYFHSLAGAKGSGGSLLQLTVRTFDLGEILLRLFGLDRPWQIALGDLALLPLNYFLELGFFFVIGQLVWNNFRKRNRPATRQELAAFTMAGVSILICTFVRSSVIANNDLGWRGFLIAQFMLLIWAADLVTAGGIPKATRSLVRACLILGVAGVMYDLAILRFYPVLSDAKLVPKIDWLAGDEQLGLRTYANREAYEWLRQRTSPRAIIEQNPNVHIQETFWGMYGHRQALAEDQGCGTNFGGDADDCGTIYKRMDELFTHGAPESFEAACEAVPVDVFVAKDTDPVWRDRSSWVWNRPAAFQNNFVRLIPCRRTTGFSLSAKW
jgi:hypothetical protein